MRAQHHYWATVELCPYRFHPSKKGKKEKKRVLSHPPLNSRHTFKSTFSKSLNQNIVDFYLDFPLRGSISITS